jgi:hypothetical protein
MTGGLTGPHYCVTIVHRHQYRAQFVLEMNLNGCYISRRCVCRSADRYTLSLKFHSRFSVILDCLMKNKWPAFFSSRIYITDSHQKLEVCKIFQTVCSLTTQMAFVFTELRVATSGVAWKGVSSEDVTYVQATDLKWAQWLRVARGFQLRLGLRDHKKERFDGFVREVQANWGPI